MHPLLARQFKRALGVDGSHTEGLPAAWLDFAAMVEQAYIDSDSDRALTQRSIDIASRELVERNRELLLKNTKLQTIEQELRSSHETLEHCIVQRTQELRETKDAAERAHQHIHLLLDSTGDGIYGIDNIGRCTFANRAAATMLGYTVQEMTGQNMHYLIHYKHADGSTHPAEECPIFRSFKLNQNLRVAEDVFWRRDGVAVQVEYSAYPVRDQDHVIGSVVAFSDISARKHVEAELRRAKELAENASRAKSEFLARMSHEIRTPLNGVVGMVDLLDSTEITATQRRYVQLARESADTLMTVINDILDFSKIEAGKMEFESVAFDPYKLVEDQVAILAPLATKRNLTVEFSVLPEVPRSLVGDPNRIRQILINLISNSLKFTTRGFITVRVSMDDQSPEHPWLRVEVQDTGIGIPAHLMDRIFKSFTQVDSSTTRRFGGTGLGLAISKRLVDLMGGQIGVQSQEGHGTTFWFTLPLAAASHVAPIGPESPPVAFPAGPSLAAPSLAAPSPAAPSPVVPKPAVQQTLKGIHLLVAEDNEMNQFVTREILKRSGCTCDVVADGQLAVDAAQRERYDAILMDCRMPGMDGLAATRRIRELEAATPGSPRIPIIALTAEAVTGDRDKCLEAGMDGYVSKPIDAKLLVAAIESMVRHPRPHPPTTAESTQSPGSANSPAAIAADPPIDVRALLGRCLSDAAFACKTLELFEQRALGDVDRLHESLVEHDSRKVNNLAHNLKAVAAHVGAMKLKNIAFEIEQAGAQQNLEFVEQQLTELAAEARRCAAFIPDAIQRLVHPEPADPSVKPSR